ncbi:Uncharacterised protein [uncultured archaeon]|nr:Uncharacterised protein [uncultured archaeon]
MGEACQRCGASIPDWDGAYWARGMLCLNCYDLKQEEENHKPCSKCGARLRPDQLTLYKNQRLCNWCLKDAKREALTHECAFCGKWMAEPGKAQKLTDGRPVCADCVEKNAKAAGGMRCYKCGERGKYPYFSPDGKVYCENCADKLHQQQKGAWKTGSDGSSILETGIGARPLFSRVVDKLKHALE